VLTCWTNAHFPSSVVYFFGIPNHLSLAVNGQENEYCQQKKAIFQVYSYSINEHIYCTMTIYYGEHIDTNVHLIGGSAKQPREWTNLLSGQQISQENREFTRLFSSFAKKYTFLGCLLS
jgi:hypothetical protein